MITTSNSQLEKLSVHYIGETLQLQQSETPVQMESAHLKELLKNWFLQHFKDLEVWTFFHETDLQFNEVYAYARRMFSNPDGFHEESIHILHHLIKSSRHHAIKPGELFVGLVSQIQWEDRTVRGLVLIKSEVKTEFLQVNREKKEFNLTNQEGLDLKRIDKGCLILDTSEGLDVFVLDNANKGAEAQYWTGAFLGVRRKINDQYLTDNYLSLAKEFITREVEASVQIERADQVDMLNRSVRYFRKNENFNETEFVDEVFGDRNVVDSFQSFKKEYNQDLDMSLPEEFGISSAVVKKQARMFKSVIKLDKNFHLYIHGNRELIEQGYDEKRGKKYYKIYFDQEA